MHLELQISVWLISVRAVVQWSCYVTTKKCPVIHCDEDETSQQLLLDCYRTKEVRNKMACVGFNIQLDIKSVMCVFQRNILKEVPAVVGDVCHQHINLENESQSHQ